MNGNDTTPTTLVDESAEPTVVVRRPRSTGKFLPRVPQASDSSDVVIGRSLMTARNHDLKPQTSRERRIAGELPAWEPLPPGELFVKRGRH